MRRIRSSPAAARSSPTQGPLDLQLQTEMLSTVPDLSMESHADTAKLSPQSVKIEHGIIDHFSHPRNHKHQQHMEQFFKSSPQHPRTDAAYKDRYITLRRSAWNWAREFFHNVSGSAALDLTQMAAECPELMEYINSTIPSGERDLWEQILHERRAEVIYSILGRALGVHVFGQELFGATPVQRERLQSIDMDMVDSDGMSAPY